MYKYIYDTCSFTCTLNCTCMCTSILCDMLYLAHDIFQMRCWVASDALHIVHCICHMPCSSLVAVNTMDSLFPVETDLLMSADP